MGLYSKYCSVELDGFQVCLYELSFDPHRRLAIGQRIDGISRLCNKYENTDSETDCAVLEKQHDTLTSIPCCACTVTYSTVPEYVPSQ